MIKKIITSDRVEVFIFLSFTLKLKQNSPWSQNLFFAGLTEEDKQIEKMLSK